MTKPPELRLVQSLKSEQTTLGGVEIFCGVSTASPPFPVDVRIVEEDTWQVLSADNSASPSDEHPIRLMTGLIDQQLLSVGELLTKGNRWRAVILDFDQEPICQHEWVEDVLKKIMVSSYDNQVNYLAMPLLGCAHDCLTVEQSIEFFVHSINEHQPSSLKKIWLSVPEETLSQVQLQLKQIANFSAVV